MNDKKQSPEIEGSIFEFLYSLFDRHNIRSVLVGGYALNANKVQRMTFDIDFLITADDCAKIEYDLTKAGYSVFNRQDAFVQFKNESPGFRDLDFLIGDENTRNQLIAQGKRVVIAGKTFIVPSPRHLIAMKLHSMAGNRKRELKDFPDIVQIMTANGMNPRDENVVELFKKYNVMDLYERVLNAIGAQNGK
jgi:Uncharacterised nucleotidyltransferase